MRATWDEGDPQSPLAWPCVTGVLDELYSYVQTE